MPTGQYQRTEKSNNAKGKHWKLSALDTAKKSMIAKASGVGKWNEGRTGEKSNSWKGGIPKKIAVARWVKENYNRIRFLSRRRRARKLGNGGSHEQCEWETLKAQYNWTCPCCKGKEPEIKLTEDHIIPISLGGSDNIENIQPLCRSCNSKKHAKIIKYAK